MADIEQAKVNHIKAGLKKLNQAAAERERKFASRPKHYEGTVESYSETDYGWKIGIKDVQRTSIKAGTKILRNKPDMIVRIPNFFSGAIQYAKENLLMSIRIHVKLVPDKNDDSKWWVAHISLADEVDAYSHLSER